MLNSVVINRNTVPVTTHQVLLISVYYKTRTDEEERKHTVNKIHDDTNNEETEKQLHAKHPKTEGKKRRNNLSINIQLHLEVAKHRRVHGLKLQERKGTSSNLGRSRCSRNLVNL